MGNITVYKWSAIDRIGNSILTFGGNIWLARMLSPDDFGLLGMVAIFSAVAINLSDCGMSDGLVHKLKPTDGDYSTLFVFNAAMGLVFGSIFIACAGLIAEMFEHPELRGIMIAIGICFFFRTMSLVQETRLRKLLDFKRLAFVRILSTSTALALAIILVLNGYGYWGIVAMQIFVNAITFVFLFIFSGWMPKLGFSMKSFKEMYGFGVHLMLAFLCAQIARNINTGVIGRVFPAAAAGAYSQAQKMEEVPYGIVESSLMPPLFSILSTAEGSAKSHKVATDMHGLAIFIFSLITVYLFLVADAVFIGLFGYKWVSAIPVFNVLLLFGFFTSMRAFYITISKSAGKTTLIRNYAVIETILQLIVLALTYTKGIEVIAFSQVIPAGIMMLLYCREYKKIIGVDLITVLKSYFSALWFSAIVLLAVGLIAKVFPADINVWLDFSIRSLLFVTIVAAIGETCHISFYTKVKRMIADRKSQI